MTDKAVVQEIGSDGPSRGWRIAGLTVLAVAAAGALAAVVVRDQMSRHRRDLFSSTAVRRLAALGYMGREPATVDNITLLRDFIAWEPRGILRRRARSILRRMEQEAHGSGEPLVENAG